MTNTLENDALLKTGKVICHIFRFVLLTFAVIAGIIAVLALLIGLVEGLAPDFVARVSTDPVGVGPAIGLSLLLAVVSYALWLSARFFKLLVTIIGTVGEGDPFVHANADRLREMGRISLIIFGLSVLATLGGIAYVAMGLPHEGSWEFDVSLESLLLALVLFILARVFRHGAEMRADLEGTV